MINKILTFVIFSTLCSLLIISCSKDDECKETFTFSQASVSDHLPNVETCVSCNAISIPSGSTDALAQAVSDICENGIIYLEAGTHTETQRVIINKSIKLVGQPGAILKLKGEPQATTFPQGTIGNIETEVGLHFLNAPSSVVQDIEFSPIASDGSTAILLQDSDDSGVINCTIKGFQFGVLVEKSDNAAMMFNNIVTTGVWLDDLSFTDAHAITIINGKNVYIADNETSNSVFGIWGCDENGIMERNNSHDNYIGYILCNVPTDYIALPDGKWTGALLPATNWTVQENVAKDNFAEGYLVIDGAHENLLQNNDAQNSGTYDIELTTETSRFGALAPEAYDNEVIAGDFPNIRIKDCGTNNKITGGVLVDTDVDECN